jgi:hypothetical protein
MRSKLRFVMHPDDEAHFAALLLSDEAVQLIDGPRWKTKLPVCSRSLEDIGWYCIIWSPADLPELDARYIESCDDYYCASEYATIQWLRSDLRDSSLTDGRIAISTHYDIDGFPEDSARQVDARFNRLRRFVKKHYVTSVARWYNPSAPFAPAGPNRSANPSNRDKSLWVGPAALAWLQADDRRRIRQFGAGTHAFVETNAGI